MLRAFIFDIGNVILRFDFSQAIRKLEQHCDPVAEAVLELIEPVKTDYESGQIDRPAFQAKVREILKYTGTDEAFIEAWQDIFTANAPMVQLIEELKPRFPLYLLSNTGDIHVEYFLKKYPVFEQFTDAVYSYNVKAAKPHRQIYEIAQRQFGVTPAETLFIDDLEANIRGAAEVGFQVHHYHHDRHAALLAQIEAAQR